MFRFEKSFRDGLWLYVKDRIKSKEIYEDALCCLEKLIDIKTEKDGFDATKAYEMEHYSVESFNGLKTISCLEQFFDKIFKVKGAPLEKEMLATIYNKIGFYNWVNEADVVRLRGCDNINSAESTTFKFTSENGCINSEVYKNCSNYIYDYINAYLLRNMISHREGEVNDLPAMEQIKYYVSTWVVYLDQALKNKEQINNKYQDDLLKIIDYKKYSTEKISQIDEKEIELLENYYIDLDWKKDATDIIEGSSIKYIGEAGAGKTTCMMNKYYETLKSVNEGKKLVLPVWIELKAFNGCEKYSLINEIKKEVNDYNEIISLLFQKGIIELYLDGYNEVLMDASDEDGTKKVGLAREIDDLHKMYPNMIIRMTDRERKPNPNCLMRKVVIYECEGMKKEQIKQYCDKRNVDIYDAINNMEWINRAIVTPGMLDMIVELLSDNIIPKDENDFYEKYIDYLLNREAEEKYETRIDELKDMLSIFSCELDDHEDGRSSKDIRDLWTQNGIDRKNARELLNLSVDMKILENKEGKNLKFRNEFYYNYFLSL